MQTITFYAYKGGTGRSLALANAARYLARLGQRVFCLDLDLEAPGLHHKLWLDLKKPRREITKGVVDWFYNCVSSNAISSSLAEYVISIPGEADSDGRITLMPAGNIFSRAYWKQLSAIDWYRMFFADKPIGIPLFMELKSLIELNFAPDFLLIDARTGITEVGGVATTILPDQVVCLLLNNRENLEGAREVLRGIRSSPRLPGQGAIELMPVLSRLPESRRTRDNRDSDTVIIEGVTEFLNEPCPDGSSLKISEVLVLHSEESLQMTESLRVGGQRSVEQSVLLRDYLRLFSRVISHESVVPHLDKFIRAAFAFMVDAPDRTQSELEALATYCPHPASLLALLKYYRLRNASPQKMLVTASQYWELSRDAQSDVVWETVQKHFRFNNPKGANRLMPYTPDFIEAAWDAAGREDIEVAINLAEMLISMFRPQKALEILENLLAQVGNDERGVTSAVSTLIGAELWDAAWSILDRYRPTLGGRVSFQSTAARLAIRQGDIDRARALIEMNEFSPAQMQAGDPMTYARLLKMIDRNDELNAVLMNLADKSLLDRSLTPKVYEAHQLFLELGKRDLFEARVRQMLSAPAAHRILRELGFATDIKPA